ncbi:MAG: nitroreductase family protein [Lachnospiraceae bacterium]|nr:nitroreductase family protein [Lachnospiraceae bacterium]
MKLKHYCVKIFGFFWSGVHDVCISLCGQANPYAILQTAHRIEKGLTIENPRRLWGWNKVEKLVKMIEKELNARNTDVFAVQTGASVLKAYIAQKESQGDNGESDRARKLLNSSEQVKKLVEEVDVIGGSHCVKKPVFSENDQHFLEGFFASRHSIREFEKKEIDKGLLIKAVEMALSCPSACNRQPSKVYCVDGDKRTSLGFDNTYQADKYLIITSDMKAFTRPEYGDWVVSTSMFAAYLVLSLHAYGIGSCVLRKEMLFGNEYNSAMRKALKIPGNEKIILELAIGYYKDDNCVAYSNRRNPEDVIFFS